MIAGVGYVRSTPPEADIASTKMQVSFGPKPVLPDFSGPLILRAQTPGLYLNRPHLKVTSAFSAG